MENANKYKLCDKNRALFYFSKCGDLNLICAAIIECDTNETNPTEELVHRALFYLRKRHPLLRAKFDDNMSNENPSDLYFLLQNVDECEAIDLKWSELASRESLTRELESFGSKLFDFESNDLVWRAKCAKFRENASEKYALCLNIPHFLTDSLNISILLIELINILNALLLNSECDEMNAELELVDDLMTLSKNRNLFIDKQQEALRDTCENNKYFKFLLDEKLRNSETETGVKIDLLKIESNISEQLVKQCKCRAEKMTGFLTACFIYALKDLYSELGLQFNTDKILVGIAVSLRNRYEPNLELNHVGNHSTLAYANLDSNILDQFNVWLDTKYINEEIRKAINIHGASLFTENRVEQSIAKLDEKIFKSFNQNSNEREKFCDQMSREKVCDIIINDAGECASKLAQINDRERIRIREIYFGDSRCSSPAITSSLSFNCSYFNNEQQILLSSNKSSIAPAHTDRLMNLFANIIQNCLF